MDCQCHETFWTLFRDAAHWEFELFLMFAVDGLLLGLLLPKLRKHWKHDRTYHKEHKDG